MKVIQAVNVNDALPAGIQYLLKEGRWEESRAGKVLVSPCPVTTVYWKPQERVLFSHTRDANPWFFLFEALWMLSGRNDARWLDQFVKDFSSRFAEDNGIQHGAYGFRWRRHFDMEGGGSPFLPDQLNTIVELLKKDPGSRQAVLTMWDPVADLSQKKRDLPCNTCVYFRIRSTGEEVPVANGYSQSKLDMTVCCRSNDIYWGCYGANIVHFSILQEYMAARIGVGIGVYYQVSNNYHIYENLLEKAKGVLEEDKVVVHHVGHSVIYNPKDNLREEYPQLTPIVTNPELFDADLHSFMEWTNNYEHGEGPYDYYNEWFSNTAEPLFAAHERWRNGDRGHALEIVNNPDFDMSPDWRLAAKNWMERRMNK